ncbi:branched-chain amino acid ABC transporter permease [Rhodoligotrophos defluvii]|uniref:branched-chain amino acid ABC transporter permease n=1 Tax=Rhodoligotrophos defluvii TaxID=2561934 RepID=UPI0010C9AAC0|nr:branched-chain amino acid ABC transporter permease [Rhodoligotrophos defluvii]
MQLAVNVVVLASIYALISCGYVLIYKVSRVLNLAHGELMMLGAYLLLTTAASVSSNPAVALAVAALLSLSVGVLVYLMLMRRMTGESVLAAVLTTIALGILIRGLVTLIWSAQQQYPAAALKVANPSVEIFLGARISLMSLFLVATCAVVYSALFAFLKLTRWGIRMRAAGQNTLLAGQRGINLGGIYAMTWGISTFTGALAGMLIALDSGLNNSMMMIGLKAFPAALVGGLDSLFGAVIGSLIVSFIEVTLIQHVDPLLSDVVPFLILIAMLIVRPWGIFGSREELDRV